MKKILAVVVALILALGCLGMTAVAEEKPLIGILAPATTHGWVGGVAYFAQQAADELDLNYKLLTSSDADEMSSQIEQLIQLGAKAIVVWPQFTGVETAAEMALEQGIIIYNFDMKINVDEKYADNMYFLSGVPTSGSVAELRKAGFTDTIAEIAPDIELITIATEFNREAGLNDMTAALTANEKIDAVFSMDDETSMGALQAIVEANRTDVKAITGGGGCQEYFGLMNEEKYQNIWVCSATYLPNMIINCVENAAAILNGETVEHEIVLESSIVDRENVQDFLNADSPY